MLRPLVPGLFNFSSASISYLPHEGADVVVIAYSQPWAISCGMLRDHAVGVEAYVGCEEGMCSGDEI